MPIFTWINQHRFIVSGFGLVLLLLGAVAGVWYFMLRSPGTQVDLRQALKLYWQGQREGSTPTDGQPEPGVYVYKTTGGEQLSIPGTARVFPSASDLIVTDSGCVSMDWVPLDEHREGTVVCRRPDGGLVMPKMTSVESIAGASTSQVIQCPSAAYFVPPHPDAGERWHAVCHGPGQVDRLTGEVVGRTTLSISGQSVPVLHTRLNFSVSGQESGTNPTDYWVSPSTGLILRQQESVSISQSTGPLGSVHYAEQMAITMTSLVPAR